MHAKILLCMPFLFKYSQLKQDDVLFIFLQGSQKWYCAHTAHNILAVNHLLQVPEQ